MYDYTAKSMTQIMEAYAQTLKAKKVVTEEPKKVIKKAKVAKPTHRVQAVNLCREEPRTIVKKCSKKGICEADEFIDSGDSDIEGNNEFLDDEEGGMENGAEDQETVSGERHSIFDDMTPEQVRQYFFDLEKNSEKKYNDDLEAKVRSRFEDEGLDYDEYRKNNPIKMRTDDEINAQLDRELGKIDDGDGSDETEDDVSNQSEQSDTSTVSDEDEVVVNGQPTTRGKALKFLRNRIFAIDSIPDEEADEAGNEEKVARLQAAMKRLRAGETEVSIEESVIREAYEEMKNAESDNDSDDSEEDDSSDYSLKEVETSNGEQYEIINGDDEVIAIFFDSSYAHEYLQFKTGSTVGESDETDTTAQNGNSDGAKNSDTTSTTTTDAASNDAGKEKKSEPKNDGGEEKKDDGKSKSFVDSAKETLTKGWDATKKAADDTYNGAKQFVKDNPKTSGAMALAGGAILGGATVAMLKKRRKSKKLQNG